MENLRSLARRGDEDAVEFGAARANEGLDVEIGVIARFLLLGSGEGARGADSDARHVVGDDDFDDGETAEDEARGEARGDEGVVGADGWEFRERAVGEGDDGAGADEGEGSSRLKKTRESTVKSNRRFSLERTDRVSDRVTFDGS